ncbi:endonuclease [Flavobacterium pallidum]|uniref:Ribonuclease n=1 Tax=Flavobacterium pallidum TaxID=2172098 RepID=A0A2S1SKI6_9FLAO|nr:endonuclease [Flavobacterium pallidum]AWI26923.1 ribonuclease [Flavobacterium pallidum]
MKKILLAAAFMLTGFTGFSQIVINEIEADTPSTDVMEFVELKSATPNFALDGYVLVLFNGTTNGDAATSYLALDLDGYVTDANGIFMIGNSQVSPSPSIVVNNGAIQNGPDGAGIYLGNASNFPNNTVATTTNLIHGVAYSNSNTVQPTALMTAMNLSTFTNENVNGAAATQSIQRKNDGTFEVKAPTPGMNNDGSGVGANGITISVTPLNLVEGSAFNVTFTTQTAVTADLGFSFTLANGSFTTSDYSGSLTAVIPAGATTVNKAFLLTDDAADEGDEIMKVSMGSVPSGYSKLNDNVEFRVHDNDYIVQPWGTPLNPTHGLATSTAPAGYYASLEGKSGAVLKQAIQDIIANPAVVHAQNYGDIFDILKEADQNPENGSQVWLMYVEQPRSKIDYQTGTSGAAGFWNREHIYAQSRGGFTNGTSSTANGIDNWNTTNADDIMAGHADGHHIRAEDSPENSLRSERNYGVDYNGPAGSAGSWHGDVARAIFYMCVRYNGLNVVNGDPANDPDGYIGDLATLLTWNMADASDDYEMNRNNVVYNWQKNRNPFIDYPLLAEYIWGSHAGETWFAALSTSDNLDVKVGLYPNPAHDKLTVSGVAAGDIEVYSMTGAKVLKSVFSEYNAVNIDLPAGVYVAKVTSEGKSTVKKLVVK